MGDDDAVMTKLMAMLHVCMKSIANQSPVIIDDCGSSYKANKGKVRLAPGYVAHKKIVSGQDEFIYSY